MSKSITIIKKEGEVQNKEFIYNNLKTTFSLLKNGEHEIIIKRKTKRRTINQNSMMWMWYSCLAQETGNIAQDFHDYYSSKFLAKTISIDGINRRVVGGTSGLDTIAMTNFLNNVQADAASEFGVMLPLPEDQSWKSFKDEYQRYM